MKKFYLLVFGLIAFSSVVYSQSGNEKTTVYIVRHGEKDLSDPKNPDPQLNAEGHERAKDLAAKLKKEKFAAIFSTKYKRTTQTGSFVATKNKLPIEIYNPAEPRALAELVRSKYKGKKVLIIGHSNTVLELTEAFGVSRSLKALTDDDYDFIFKIEIDQSDYATLKTGNYGKSHHTSLIK